MTDNPYLKAKQDAAKKSERMKHYQAIRKENVPDSFMQNLASTYTRINRPEVSSQSPLKSPPSPNPYTSAQLSPAEKRRRQKAEMEKRQAEEKQAQRERREEQQRIQQQARKEQELIDNFLNNMRRLDPMHPDRRWFDEYKDSCPNERQAALDLIKLQIEA